jgi:hypothetical protein
LWSDMAGGAEMAAMRGPAGIGSELDEAPVRAGRYPRGRGLG